MATAWRTGLGSTVTGVVDHPSPERELPAAGTQPKNRQGLRIVLLCFLALFSVLMFKNRHLFSAPIYDHGDFAANSILTENAKSFSQLVGHYSREGFNHPGPVFMYVQAAGEFTLHDATGLVRTPYDGQAIAILALNAALLTLSLAIIYRRSKSAATMALAVATVLAFGSVHHLLLGLNWMPFVFFAPFLLLLVSAASVAGGESRHLWCLALAAGLLVHGHVEFLFFAPGVVLVALGILLWRHRTGVADLFTARRRDWLGFATVVLVFLLPIALNVVLHWPGEFGKYWLYSTSSSAGGHSFGDALSYVLQFWSRDPDGGYLLPGLVSGLALAMALRHSDPAMRRFLSLILGFSALATGLFVIYAMRGIDYLNQPYIGYFYWAVPMAVIFVALVAAVDLVPARSTNWLFPVAALVALLAMRGPGLVNNYTGEEALPAVVKTLAAQRTSPRQTVVLDIDFNTWPDAVGVLVQADRIGVHACLADPLWTFMVTKEFICTGPQARDGVRFHFHSPGSATMPVIETLPMSQVTRA